ncbi:Cell growth-regulating nucleolar protein [Trichinella papuae]|uniref:Cell growth-regulating nucleolar protein n=1 Tax=Trichinella papuae TaxID=268474 RepID=A0A0V1MUS3_9BILA|nr:Cell growth-regulating nucleolar protein [Trichinella papuae]
MDKQQDEKSFTSENMCFTSGQSTVQSRSISEETSILLSQAAIMDVVESLRPSNRQDGIRRMSGRQISGIQVGRRFKSFLEFEQAFDAWKSKHFHTFRVASSESLCLKSGVIDPVFRYRSIVYQCAHYGTPHVGGQLQNQKINYLPCGCSAMLQLNYNWSEHALYVSTLHEEHSGHPVSAEAYKEFAAKSRLHKGIFSAPLPSTTFSNCPTLKALLNRNVDPFFDQDNHSTAAESVTEESIVAVNDEQANEEKVEPSTTPRTDEERFQMIHVVLQSLCDHLLETEDTQLDEKLAQLAALHSQWQAANLFEMVFFTCNGCGESVKKVQVVKHRMRCRRSYVISCMDCGQDFKGEEYNEHKKCISEQAKYSGGTIENKETKGELKQQSWIENVQCAIDSVKSSNFKLRQLLETLKSYSNIPRKQVKFENFIKNSLRVRDVKLIKNAWQAISDTQLSSVESGEKTSANITVSNDCQFDEQSKHINKKNEIIADSSNHKRKSEDDLDKIGDNDRANKVQKLDNGEQECDTIVGKPKCKSVIKKILIEQLNKEMKLKKLYKAALSALSDRYSDKYTPEQLIRFIGDAIMKSSKFQVDGKVVRFVE